jgi:polyphosphate glucokinase
METRMHVLKGASTNDLSVTTAPRRILVVDIGGTNVKLLASGQTEWRNFPSGRRLTPAKMVEGVKALARGWDYDVVSLGYPGTIHNGRPAHEPNNLAGGWVAFNYEAAFGCPVKLINDAVMQALGSYRGGTMLFLGLGTGLGSALVVDCTVVPLRLAALPYRKGTVEDHLGTRGLQRYGKRKWRKFVERLTNRFVSALELDDVVLGGGNAKELKTLPPACRLGNNTNAFIGGFQLWGGTEP